MRRRRDWPELLRSLGRALADLAGAEAEALGRDFARSGKHLVVITALAVVMAGLVFWLLGVLTAALVALIALWLPVWGAALAVAGFFLLVVAVLALVAWRHARRLEGPARIVGRRWRDHADWWQVRVLGEPPTQRTTVEVDRDDD